MSNQFLNLPAPSADGSGAAIDVSSCGAMKTIVSSGDSVATLNVEINNDVAHAGSWTTVGTFTARGILRLMLACRWMRVTVSRYTSGTPQIDFGSSTDGATFAALPVSVGDGTGAAVDVSALGLFKTVQVGGPFAGIVNIEISEDGNTKWATLFTFDAPGQQSLPLEAHWMRVVRAGQKPMIPPGTPIVTVGGTDAGGGGAVSAGQRFVYTAFGGEGAAFDVPLPVPLAPPYAVFFEGDSATFFQNAPVEEQTLNSFRVHTSFGTPARGQKFTFYVDTLTAPVPPMTPAFPQAAALQTPPQESGGAFVLAGDSIVVTGLGFTGVTAAKVNGVATPFTPIDDTSLTLTALPAAPTEVLTVVALTNPGGVGKKGILNYSHFRTLGIDGASPASGITRRGGYSLLLNTGKILIFGGTSDGAQPDDRVCFLYDPATNLFTATGAMNVWRASGMAAVLLNNGKILACGGRDPGGGVSVTSAELYDPGTGLWVATPAMTVARENHTAHPLPNGNAVIIGGTNAAGVDVASSEIYNTGANTWGNVAATPTAVAGGNSCLLAGGDVVLFGGTSASPSFGKTALYNHVANTWAAKLDMLTPRRGLDMRSKLLPSGKVITVAGTTNGAAATATSNVDIYDPVANTWTAAPDIQNLAFHVELVKLSSGDIVRIGGFDDSDNFLLTAEQFNEGTGLWTTINHRHSSKTPVGLWDPLNVPILGSDQFFSLTGSSSSGGGANDLAPEQFRP